MPQPLNPVLIPLHMNAFLFWLYYLTTNYNHMKPALLLILSCLLLVNVHSQESQLMKHNVPVYRIRITTMQDNVLKGLLTEVKDSSLVIYPGKRKEWKHGVHYPPVEFGYSNITQISVKKKNGAWRGMLIGGSVGTVTVIPNISKRDVNEKD